MKKILSYILLFCVCLPSVQAKPVEEDHWSDDYDRYFKKYTKRYFGPHFDWRWFKSQGIAESNLNTKAKSHVGAQGIMQLMPATYEEIKQQNPTFRGVLEPKWNIAAGIFYDRQLYRKWRKPLPSEERLFLAFSSYNAGYGRVLKAVKRTKKPDYTWVQVKAHLPKETKGYVTRIAKLMDVQKRNRTLKLRGLSSKLSGF
ncbi:MAG: transglycosylase SLT domain-containing protein [Gammaproteobacteria bacterium]|nr:transglycosylase SLT domain-containing protein [Gammaproteobacteria bacterium]